MKRLYLLLFFSGSLAFANLITGKILDIDSKAPVIGANVELGLNGEGTATDNFGMFFIESDSKQPDKLKISHIAYLDLEYQIEDDQKILIYLEPSVINVDELIVTGTRTQKTFKDSPILTRIIHNQEIKESQSRNLNDIMNEIFPGYQRLKGEHSMSNEVQFNGLGTKSLLFLVDGQRVNAEFAGNMDLSIIDINNIERIEYVDGSMSTLYGSGAMGGTVNVITKKMGHFNLNANLLINEPIISSRYISSSYKLWDFDLFSSLSQNQSKGFDLKEIEYSNPTEIQKHQEEFNNITLNQKINYRRNQTDYMLSYRFHQSEVNTYRVAFIDGNPFSGLSTFPSFELPKNKDSAISFKIKSEINPSTFIVFNLNSEDYKKYYRYTGYNEEFWSGSYNKNGSITLNKNNSKLSYLVGIDIMKDKYQSYDVDGDGDGLIDEGSIFENGTSKNNNQYSIFMNSDILLNDLNIISGLRYQYHDAYKGHIIPMISLCKKYDKYNFRSTWSKGYRAPNLKELYYQWNHPGGEVLGNSALQPEESEYFSLSLESVKDFYYSINLYYNSLNNMISYITDGTTHIYTNFEEVSLTGMNLFYKRKLSNRGEFTFSYNYLDAYNHIHNTKLNGTNHHNLNIRLSYFISDKVKTRLAFKYSSPKQYNTCVQNCDGDENIYELSDFSLLDFSVRYNFSEFVSATLGIDNIFDYKDPNAENEQFLTVINPGRSMVISFDYNINRPYEK